MPRFSSPSLTLPACGEGTLSRNREKRPREPIRPFDLDTLTSYSYDADKQWLKGIARGGGGDSREKADHQYDDSDGWLTTVVYGNGAYATYDYWASGQLSKISYFTDADTFFYSMAYAYDPPYGGPGT